jgi:hypothetical protein
MQHLSSEQRKAVGRLARSKGITCKECDSAQFLASDDTARQAMSYINTTLFCTNPDADHPNPISAMDQSFALSFDEADAIGIRVQGRNQPPRRRPGETFPR